MLLAFDVGNSNVKIGLLGEDGRVHDKMRISSQLQRTADEYNVFVNQFLQQNQFVWQDIEGIIISSVVPLITGELSIFLEKHVEQPYAILGPGAKTGLKINTEHPHELGADLVANAAGAYYLSQGKPCIAIAFGTATTFTVVNSRSELQGVAIAPGVETALVSLVKNTALLRQVKLEMPRSSIGRNTQEAIRAGLILGNLGTVEYIVQQQLRELRQAAGDPELDIKLYSTGFFGKFYQQHSHCLGEFEEDLLFLGLQQIWQKNI
ncbi:type III pantothenate kinase [Candidatus Haliotispira prima]|uniref:Type III pantothenate kinase n=1 Tax=Candidatus Haliotispira prima TaxID=3034016 RepID=A0ABY8MM02_9SPIO|nr:type III pantothenate kinase [Candidatus Haliotispira prima]